MMGKTIIDRKNFLGRVGKGALAAFIISVLPGSLFSSKIKSRKTEKLSSIKIKAHPDAVKRIKKVS